MSGKWTPETLTFAAVIQAYGEAEARFDVGTLREIEVCYALGTFASRKRLCEIVNKQLAITNNSNVDNST